MTPEDGILLEFDVTKCVPGPFTTGWFYVVALDSNECPTRVKVGYSTNVPKRIKNYKTTNPYARAVACFPCSGTATERDVIFLLDSDGGFNRIEQSEVFDVPDVDDFLDEIERLLDGVEAGEHGFTREEWG